MISQIQISKDLAHLADSIIQMERSEQIDGVVQFQECHTQYYLKGKELFKIRIFKYYGDPNDSTALWTYYDENGWKSKTIEWSKTKTECVIDPVSPFDKWILIGPNGEVTKKNVRDSVFLATSWCETNFTDTLDASHSISTYCGNTDERFDTLYYTDDRLKKTFFYYENGFIKLKTYYQYQFDESARVIETARVDSSGFLTHTTTEKNIYINGVSAPLVSMDYENDDVRNLRSATWIYDDKLRLIGLRFYESGFLKSFTKIQYDGSGKQVNNYTFNGDSTLLSGYDYFWRDSKRRLECWRKSSDSLNIYTRIDTTIFLGRFRIRTYHADWVASNENYKTIRRSACQLDRVVRYDSKGRIVEEVNYDFNTGRFLDISKWRYLKRYRNGISHKT